MAGIFNASIFNNAIFNTGAEAAAVAEPGAYADWGKLRQQPRKKKKGGTVIRRSDFESLIKYEEALRELLKPIPMSDVPLEGNVVTVEEDEDEDIIALVLAKVLH